MVSQKLRAAIKLGDEPAYKIAHKAGLDPSTLSKLICGIVKVKDGDQRVIKVGKVLGIPPKECFREEAIDEIQN
ncbi:MAG: hypothetical protein ISS67_06000 [Desulfobacterales bacterium]|uniref:Uncharacterized protein n=1 Tax=Candidatus Desulfatibia profunda TaxID=2841695 RepID=A0A8J6NUY4_9BACT|nr:hypothetical protein [Candidatus Desulfatibia profunda]MBL7180281.1 hypothetical protein [Desulfobacterales bacterium]MBL7208058.1 hypothetical protein [Desulfobacterales bacterium]